MAGKLQPATKINILLILQCNTQFSLVLYVYLLVILLMLLEKKCFVMIMGNTLIVVVKPPHPSKVIYKVNEFESYGGH